ncbi:MAG TPA: alpha/beta hydrolase [Pseudomonadales bacterium]|nr:alpha/beta hydrolase [Pseudomonadales bacterium]
MNDTPREQHSTYGDFEMAWFEWAPAAGSEDAPTILLVHATGFHARCWDRVVALLEGRHVIAIDMRGHGRSSNTPPFDWDTFGDDLIAFVRERKLHGAVAVGHSMGGHCVVQAAAQLPDAFSRLVLIDPVILPVDAYAARETWDDGEEHPTAKRRNAWQDWEEMRDRFADRLPFSAWDPRVLEDYCRYGVAERADAAPGDKPFELACPPSVEASIYMGSASRDIHAQAATVQVPVTVLRARARSADRNVMDFSGSPTDPALADVFPQGRDVHLPDSSHFIPMENPALAADFILDRR